MNIFDKYTPSIAVESATDQPQISPDQQLFMALDTISTEAAFIGNMGNYFKRKLSHFGMSITEGFNYLTTWNYDPMLPLSPLIVRGAVDTLDYLEVGGLMVQQPNGFKGELLPYTGKLIRRTEIMHRIIDNAIKPLTMRFGHYLANPSERSETRDFQFPVTLGNMLPELIKEDSEHFTNNRQATVKFNKLFSSMSEFVSCIENIHEVSNAVKAGGTEDIKGHVKNLVDTVNALMTDISTNKEHEASKEFTKMLSEELKIAAQWVEWYAVQMTRIIETNNTLHANVQILRAL